MTPTRSPLAAHQAAFADGSLNGPAVAENVIAHANGNASRNTYLHFDADALRREAASLAAGPLHGVAVSLKDLFDLRGTVTSAATRFYADRNEPAADDSEMASRIHRAGALITGKTHLHPLAYGITGENPVFSDCLQPRDPALLTGGSSSGAVASVQEGSALAAIGTDTGGSIRVPAALGGLVGYRASHAIRSTGIWRGGLHLAPSFDTPGFLLRDPRDAAPIAQALFGISPGIAPPNPRIGTVPLGFCHDAEPEVLACFAAWKQHLSAHHGATCTDLGTVFDTDFLDEAVSILVPIQASEAAAIHREHLDALAAELDPAITARMRFGAWLTAEEVAGHRERLRQFRVRFAHLLAGFDFLMIPCAPFSRLLAGADHTATRAAIIRYTAPFSLAGTPVLSLPGELVGAPLGTGIQLAAAQNDDSNLLAFAAALTHLPSRGA